MRIATSAFALMFMVAPIALAGDGHNAGSIVSQIFESADTDDSGSLDADEYGEAGLASYGTPFEDCDANADGETTLEEYLDLYARHHPHPSGI